MIDTIHFSSESVGEGHPDKVADFISDSILDACLEQDSNSRVACETLVKNNLVVLAGEITTNAKLNYEEVVRKAIREIGYIFDDNVFHADHVFILNSLTKQSDDIKIGVEPIAFEGKKTAEQGAGDQGIMFGYACKETPEYMPAGIMFAHKINQKLSELRKNGVDWLRPDCKSQVAVEYKNGLLSHVKNVIVSTQHSPEKTHAQIEEFCIEKIIKEVIPSNLLTKETEFFINPTGRFVLGGPSADAGLTGRKIIVDTYGGVGRHGGGAFSGKDPSKVDRSAAYMCRWVAKNIVAAGLADAIELQIAYAIGHPNPTSMSINTFNTNDVSNDAIIYAIKENFSFKPADIITQLNLLRPIYRQTTNYGHFTKQFLPWEQTNQADTLRNLALNFEN